MVKSASLHVCLFFLGGGCFGDFFVFCCFFWGGDFLFFGIFVFLDDPLLSHNLIYLNKQTITLMYKNIIRFFSFPFMTKCTKYWNEGEGRRWLSLHTHKDGAVFLLNLSAFLLRSAFARLVQGHLKAFTHVFFFVLLSQDWD